MEGSSLSHLKAKHFLIGALLAGILFPLTSFSAGMTPVNIQVLGLYRDKAAVRINGVQMILSIGVPVKGGVVLMRSNSKRAIIEINGVQKSYGLGSQVSARLSKPVKTIVRIPSRRGMYLTQGLINGRSVDFLVDTGASVVAMSRTAADKLQIPYRETGERTKVSTAAALSDAWKVQFDSVSVGGISVSMVEGIVIDTEHDQQILLGMSFLGRIKFTQEAGMIVLEARAQ